MRIVVNVELRKRIFDQNRIAYLIIQVSSKISRNFKNFTNIYKDLNKGTIDVELVAHFH